MNKNLPTVSFSLRIALHVLGCSTSRSAVARALPTRNWAMLFSIESMTVTFVPVSADASCVKIPLIERNPVMLPDVPEPESSCWFSVSIICL
jgi:hypothetical protein